MQCNITLIMYYTPVTKDVCTVRSANVNMPNVNRTIFTVAWACANSPKSIVEEREKENERSTWCVFV